MAEYTKSYYSISEASQLLGVPIYTLRFWEQQIPIFKPHRSAGGTRKFTPADMALAAQIKVLLYDKGLKVDAAADYLARNYRKRAPRQLRKCQSNGDAIDLLSEVMEVQEDAHAMAKLQAVINYLNHSAG